MDTLDMKNQLMSTGIFKTEEEAISYLIAQIIADSDNAIGSWSIKDKLDLSGVILSTASIGRYLKLLDSKEYTIRKSNQGRVLTPMGKIWLAGLQNKLDRAKVQKDFTRRIRVNEYADMVDLIKARKLIEVETAKLAALNADNEDIAIIKQTLSQHHEYVDQNVDPVNPALDFHLSLAKASKNKFLYAMLYLLAYEEKQIEAKIVELRTREMGKIYVVDHDKIADAVVTHDAEEAGKLMELHMQDILDQVELQVDELYGIP